MTKEELPNKRRYSHGVNHSSTTFPTAANPFHVRARQLALKKASMDGTTAPSTQRTSTSMPRLPAEAAPSACIGQWRGHPPLLPAEAVMVRWWWCQKTCWRVVDEVNDRLVGNLKRRFDEYSSKFSLSYETKVVNPVGKRQYSRRRCPLASRQLRIIYRAPRPSFALRAATWNLDTAQPNTLFPTYDEVVNLTGLLETKGWAYRVESNSSMRVK
jgi:hypothetical protein